MPDDQPSGSDQERRTRHVVRGAGGVRLAAWSSGPRSAPVVVCVHGYPDSHTVWDLVADELCPEFRVVVYDVRGAGESEAPDEVDDYRIENLVGDIAAVVEESLNEDDDTAKVHLVGHDWGSIQCWSALFDERVSSRIAGFTSISGPGLSQVGPWMRERSAPGSGHWRDLLRQGVRSWYIAAFQSPLATLPWRTGLGRRWQRLMERVEGAETDARWPSSTLVSDATNGVKLYKANLAPRSPRPPLRQTSIPVQLVVALRDSFVTASLADSAELVASNLTRTEVDSGHWLPRSEPKRLAAAVRDFVSQLES